MNSEDKKTVYEQIGGAPAVEAAVEVFYKKVLGDPELMGFFQETNMTFQKQHQRDFITFLTGGSDKYAGKDMRAAHKHLHLTDEHFDAIKTYLGETLLELGVDKNLVSSVAGVIEGLRTEVLNR
jgi:hemoglobin